MGRKRKLLYDVGLNDSDYKTRRRKSDGKVEWCPYFLRWKKMLERCYSSKSTIAYRQCSVSPEWLIFSNFKNWMEEQDWQGKELDKDLKVKGNKIYSDKFCVFVDKKVNSFLVSGDVSGWTYNTAKKKYQAQCSDPLGRRSSYIGYFTSEDEARSAWLRTKRKYAKELSEMCADPEISQLLINYYGE